MIDLENEVVKEITNVLVMQDPESHQLYLESINNESGEGTQNSRFTHRWDYRYNNLIKVAKKHRLKYVKLSRGKLWEAILVIGPENELYVFFSKANLRNILKRGKENHYLKLLNLFNEQLDEMETLRSQITLPFEHDEEEWDDSLLLQAREMLHMMEEEPSKVIVFAFDTSFISTVTAFAFNSHHELVWEKELTELIDVNYHLVLQDDQIDPEERESSTFNEAKKDKKRIVKLKAN